MTSSVVPIFGFKKLGQKRFAEVVPRTLSAGNSMAVAIQWVARFTAISLLMFCLAWAENGWTTGWLDTNIFTLVGFGSGGPASHGQQPPTGWLGRERRDDDDTLTDESEDLKDYGSGER